MNTNIRICDYETSRFKITIAKDETRIKNMVGSTQNERDTFLSIANIIHSDIKNVHFTLRGDWIPNYKLLVLKLDNREVKHIYNTEEILCVN
jgi:hypothetical protein